MNYYRRYCGDYLRDTPDLTLAEHGAYTLLLDLYYSLGHPIPYPIELLHRICRAVTPAEQAAVESVAERFFPMNGDGSRHNKRADKEIELSTQAIAKMSRAGHRGAMKRWMGNPIGHPNHNPKENDGVTDASSNHHPPTTKERSKTTPSRKKAPFELPDWVPQAQWDAWIESRTKRRNPPTDWAKKLAVNRLLDLQSRGHSPALVLAESAFNGWAGLFEPKGQK